jgi:hypothetical protein
MRPSKLLILLGTLAVVCSVRCGSEELLPAQRGAGGSDSGESATAASDPSCGDDRLLGPEDGPTVTLPVPPCVSIITLRETTAPVPAEGEQLTMVYPPLPASTSAIWWVVVRESHQGGRWIASFGNGGSDAPSHDPNQGATATFVLVKGHWTLGGYGGAVNVGLDATP